MNMASVLVVEDDSDSREVVAKFLQNAGHRVTTASDGFEAMAAITTVAPHVIVLDYKMPKMDGISFLEVIRCYLRWQSLPVILLTAFPDGQHIKRAEQLGVKKIFVKSAYELPELAALVDLCAPSRGGGHNWSSSSARHPLN